MNTRVVGKLENRKSETLVSMGKYKGYKVNWNFNNAVPTGQADCLDILRSPKFKLWDTDWGFSILAMQVEDRKDFSHEMNLRIYLHPQRADKKIDDCPPDIESSMVAFYDDQCEPLKFHSEMPYFTFFKTNNRIKALDSNIFALEAYSDEQGHPDLSGEFDINWDIGKYKDYDLDKSRRNWDRVKGAKKLSDDLSSMVEDSEGADVKIKCGKKELTGHKFILAVRAKGLYKMIEQSPESLDLSKVEGQPIQPESVQAMINWIYTGKFDVEKNILPNLSQLAQFCEMNELKESCALKIELNEGKEEMNRNMSVDLEPPPAKSKKSRSSRKSKKSMPKKNPDGSRDNIGEIVKITPWNQRSFNWRLNLPNPGDLAQDEIKRVKSPEINFMGIDCYLLLNFGYNEKQRPCFWISLESSPGAEELMDRYGICIKSKFTASYPGMMCLIDSANPDWYFDDYELEQLQREEFVYMGDSNEKDDEKDGGVCLNEGTGFGPRPPRIARDSENSNKFHFRIPARCFMFPEPQKDRDIIFHWTLRIEDEGREFGKSHAAQKKALLSLSDDFGTIFGDLTGRDLTLECLGKDLTCHKRILMARSSVFKDMLGGEMMETEESKVQVKDQHGELVNPEIVQEMLRWIYMGEFREVGVPFTLPLLELANYYDLGQLKSLCAVKLEGALSPENVIDVLIAADLVKAEDLKMSAMEFINKNKEIKESADFEGKMSEKLRGEISEMGLSGF